MDNLNILDEFRFDKRHRRKSTREILAIKETLRIKHSFMAMERARGIQPLCKRCALKCKVLNGENSTFECFDFVEKKK